MKVVRNGNEWKRLREKAGLTQREVSDSLGYSTPQFISNVERGRCRFPVEKLPKIKKLYRLSTDQVLNLFLTEERMVLMRVFKRASGRN
ncbi:MAG TPA: helix-turn-helix transcriptional regulator [Bdellovibrionales bacterium]|nr:helix-turn-helix transcriptional regulator [Bdellovibrionales bacterium]